MNRCEILKQIAAELSSGEVTFPTNATLALELRRALSDPECHVDQAARLIKAEPLLSAKVVALANASVFNTSGRPITDVRSAISRIGFRTLHTLSTSLVTRQLAHATSPMDRRFAARLWEHTTHVAALAYVIARSVTGLDPETALFAGVVHEVGGFYVISRSADFPGLLDEDFSAWSECGEADIGRVVLRMLEVPDSVVEAIEACWEGYLALPPTTLGDTLLLAEELSPMDSPLRVLDGVHREGLRASIDMVVGKASLSEIMAESAHELKSLTAALR